MLSISQGLCFPGAHDAELDSMEMVSGVQHRTTDVSQDPIERNNVFAPMENVTEQRNLSEGLGNGVSRMIPHLVFHLSMALIGRRRGTGRCEEFLLHILTKNEFRLHRTTASPFIRKQTTLPVNKTLRRASRGVYHPP